MFRNLIAAILALVVSGAHAEEIGWRKGQYLPNIAYIKDGAKTSLHRQRGKILFVNFWASWCGPCRKEMRYLQKASDHYRDNDGVEFLLLNMYESYGDGVAYINEKGWTLPIADSYWEVVDEASKSKQVITLGSGERIDYAPRPRTIPKSYVIAADGKTVKIFVREIKSARWIQKAIDKALSLQ